MGERRYRCACGRLTPSSQVTEVRLHDPHVDLHVLGGAILDGLKEAVPSEHREEQVPSGMDGEAAALKMARHAAHGGLALGFEVAAHVLKLNLRVDVLSCTECYIAPPGPPGEGVPHHVLLRDLGGKHEPTA